MPFHAHLRAQVTTPVCSFSATRSYANSRTWCNVVYPMAKIRQPSLDSAPSDAWVYFRTARHRHAAWQVVAKCSTLRPMLCCHASVNTVSVSVIRRKHIVKRSSNTAACRQREAIITPLSRFWMLILVMAGYAAQLAVYDEKFKLFPTHSFTFSAPAMFP